MSAFNNDLHYIDDQNKTQILIEQTVFFWKGIEQTLKTHIVKELYLSCCFFKRVNKRNVRRGKMIRHINFYNNFFFVF